MKLLLSTTLIFFYTITNAHANEIMQSCYAFQPAAENNRKIFNIKDFNKYKNPVSLVRTITLSDGGTITQRKTVEGYAEGVYQLNSPYMCLYYYDKKGHLLESQNKFYGLSVGVLIEYDKKGNIINQIDFDKDYPFSATQLVEKMKHDFNIDLLNESRVVRVRRFIDELHTQKIYYEVIAYVETSKNYPNSYILDASTGELLFVKNELMLPNRVKSTPTAFPTYLESLNTTQQP